MTNGLDDATLAVWRSFITAHARVIERIDRDLAAAGCVPLHWYDVLVELVEAPEGRLRMHQLAEQVVLSRSGLTRLVDRLEGAGLLRRERSGTDRRGAYAVLTEQGRAALRAAWPVYARGIQRYFGRYVGRTQTQELQSVLERVVEAAR